jgi:protein-disulfide isomerase
MILRLFRAALSIIVLSPLIGLPPTAAAAQFTPAQRAEIVQILRDALKQDPSILRDAFAALRADEAARQRQALLAHQASLVGPADPVAGNPSGDVTVIEFFDVRCPYCRKLEPDMQQLLATDHGVRVVYKDLPILGPASILASRALLAAQKQGAYDRLRALLMRAPPDITEATIEAAAGKVGIDWARLQRDMSDPAAQQRLNANLKLANDIGIDGTPTLVIGGELIPGAVDVAQLQQAVAAARVKNGH